jgi:signal transduction histidine kinase/DNA-binding response OmpR family regulator
VNSPLDADATIRTSAVVAPRETIRVLVIEDNVADARYLEETLGESRQPEFACTCVADLAEARRVLSESSFEVILVDLSLPDAMGISTVEQMRALAPSTPFIVLTGNTDDTLALRAVQAGAQDYLQKGAEDPRSLSRAIRYAIERRKAEDAAIARAHAEEMARQAHLLADATRVLNESLDVERTLVALARIAVPTLGDYGWIDLVDGEDIRRVVCEGHDRKDSEPLAAVMAFPPRRDNARHPTIAAIATGATIVSDARTASMRDGIASSSEHRAVIDKLDPRTAVTVPLRARATTIGALTIVRRSGGQDFTASDIAFAEDLASRSALAVDNARTHRAAQQAALAREEMIAVVSHDLRNPLSIVGLTLQRLNRIPEVVASAGPGMIDRAQRALARTNRLLDDLLEIARIDAGALALHRSAVVVAELLNEAADLHRPLADEKKISLMLAIEPGLPSITCDRDRLAQVLANLIGNALKFTPPSRTVTIGATRLRTESHVRFFVADEGPGIAADHLPRLFDRFYRTPDAKQPGTGLGLAIARGIVAAHGGSIRARSELGHGATFEFTIPV